MLHPYRLVVVKLRVSDLTFDHISQSGGITPGSVTGFCPVLGGVGGVVTAPRGVVGLVVYVDTFPDRSPRGTRKATNGLNPRGRMGRLARKRRRHLRTGAGRLLLMGSLS